MMKNWTIKGERIKKIKTVSKINLERKSQKEKFFTLLYNYVKTSKSWQIGLLTGSEIKLEPRCEKTCLTFKLP